MSIFVEDIKKDLIISRKNDINNQDELKLLQIINPNVKKVTNGTMKDFLKKIGMYIPSKSKSSDLKNKLLKIIEHTPEEGWDENKLKEYVFENEELNEKKTGRKKETFSSTEKHWKKTENKIWEHYQEGQEFDCSVVKQKLKILKKTKHDENKNSKSDVFLNCLNINKNKELGILIQVKQTNYNFVCNWKDHNKLITFINNSKEEKEAAIKEMSDYITSLKKDENILEKIISDLIKFQTDNKPRTAPNIITNNRYLTGIGMCFSRTGPPEYKIKSPLLKKIVTEGHDEGIDYKIISILGKDEEYDPNKHNMDMKEYYQNIDIYFQPRPIYSISGVTNNNKSFWLDYEFCQFINRECHKRNPNILPLEFLNLRDDAIKNVKGNFEYNGHTYILQRESNGKKYKNLNCYYPEE